MIIPSWCLFFTKVVELALSRNQLSFAFDETFVNRLFLSRLPKQRCYSNCPLHTCAIGCEFTEARDELKGARTSQNEKKWSETTRKIAKTQIEPKFQNLENITKMLSPNPQMWVYWAKKYYINKIFHVPYFEGVGFKPDICFKNVEPKSPNLGILGQKMSTF